MDHHLVCHYLPLPESFAEIRLQAYRGSVSCGIRELIDPFHRYRC